MKIITNEDIAKLDIKNKDILTWVKEAFLSKKESILPHKISITFDNGTKFYNTMPTVMPTINSAGVKIVSRYPDRKPSIQGHILLYELTSGNPLAMLDASWITAQRTGAVAYLAMQTFAKKESNTVAIMGLGQTGQAFIDMMSIDSKNLNKHIKLLEHNNQAIKLKEKMRKIGFRNISICYSYKELIVDSDVIVSAVTYANTIFGKDEWFKNGVLVIPIHTRGFQNCDLFFDKIFADDTEHVRDFKYFEKFKQFAEFDEVLHGIKDGRTSDEEKILSYNIGIALHDIFLAKKIYDRLKDKTND
jgi:ornithine cyclodeaminase/alanine dehydrogenase-like protein (mu-crystallin family)